jgi:hypothetical protein
MALAVPKSVANESFLAAAGFNSGYTLCRSTNLQQENPMKKFLAVTLATAIASTLTFAQTPIYNNGTRSAFSATKLTEVKHRRKHKRHKHRKVAASVRATVSASTV